MKQDAIFGDSEYVQPFVWTAMDRGDGKWYLRGSGASVGNGIVIDEGKLKVKNVGCKLSLNSSFAGLIRDKGIEEG